MCDIAFMQYSPFILLFTVLLLSGCLSDSDDITAETSDSTDRSPVSETPVAEPREEQPADLSVQQPVMPVAEETADELIARLNQLIADTDGLILDTATALVSPVDLPQLHGDIYDARRRLLEKRG